MPADTGIEFKPAPKDKYFYLDLSVKVGLLKTKESKITVPEGTQLYLGSGRVFFYTEDTEVIYINTLDIEELADIEKKERAHRDSKISNLLLNPVFLCRSTSELKSKYNPDIIARENAYRKEITDKENHRQGKRTFCSFLYDRYSPYPNNIPPTPTTKVVKETQSILALVASW